MNGPWWILARILNSAWSGAAVCDATVRGRTGSVTVPLRPEQAAAAGAAAGAVHGGGLQREQDGAVPYDNWRLRNAPMYGTSLVPYL